MNSTDRTDSTDRHEVIMTALLDIVGEVAEPREHLEEDQALVDQLGLTSLHLARVVAVLEMELGLDPFSELVPVTSVRTVGDLLRVYDMAATGQRPDEAAFAPAPAAPGRTGSAAARARRDARARAGGES